MPTIDAIAPDAIHDAGADVDPLEPCSGSRDVFYFDLVGSGVGYLAQTVRHTNLDATWQFLQSPDVLLLVSTGADSYSFELATSNEKPLADGTYDESSATGPWPSVSMNGIACNIVGGTLHIDDVAYADGGARITRLLVSYDGRCSPDFAIHGCVRYEDSP